MFEAAMTRGSPPGLQGRGHSAGLQTGVPAIDCERAQREGTPLHPRQGHNGAAPAHPRPGSVVTVPEHTGRRAHVTRTAARPHGRGSSKSGQTNRGISSRETEHPGHQQLRAGRWGSELLIFKQLSSQLFQNDSNMDPLRRAFSNRAVLILNATELTSLLKLGESQLFVTCRTLKTSWCLDGTWLFACSCVLRVHAFHQLLRILVHSKKVTWNYKLP